MLRFVRSRFDIANDSADPLPVVSHLRHVADRRETLAEEDQIGNHFVGDISNIPWTTQS